MTLLRSCIIWGLAVIISVMAALPARALDAVILSDEAIRIPILSAVETTAATQGGADLRFALVNESKVKVTKIIATPDQPVLNSALFWPHLAGPRLEFLKAEKGATEVRRNDARHDVFSITLDPGQTVVFTARAPAALPAQIYIWDPETFEQAKSRTAFYQGLLLGLAGLLAIFLSSLYIVRRQIMFPAAAFVSWAALFLLLAEFDMYFSAFGLGATGSQIMRAGSEVLLLAGILTLFYIFLELPLRIPGVRYLAFGGIGAFVLLLLVAVVIPSAPAGLARVFMLLSSFGGAAIIVYLTLKGANRAQMILPAWGWFIIWSLLALLSQTGVLNAGLSGPLYTAGLVLLVLLFAFTVIQYAFGGDLPDEEGITARTGLNALAFTTTGLGVWDWDVKHGRIRADAEVERRLELRPGTLDTDESAWTSFVHSNDRVRLETVLHTVAESPDGWLNIEFRMRRSDGVYRWFRLTARPVLRDQGKAVRFIGALQDINAKKNAEERLLHDAVHDSLTGLPNRALFMDRLDRAIERANAKLAPPPAVIVIDFDRFRNVNDAFGHAAGDSLLLVMARRMERCIGVQDTLARLSGDDFVVILGDCREREEIEAIAHKMRKTVAAPLQVNNREVFLTASLGLSVYGKQRTTIDLLKEAEIAMNRAKSLGKDKVEAFKPSMRSERKERLMLESDLRRALERQEIDILYQPVVSLEDEHLAGFEALVRWRHPEHGELAPRAFLSIAEETGLIIELGRFVLDASARQLGTWQRAFSQNEPIFVSVNVSSRQLFSHDLIEDVKVALARSNVIKGTLKLEITESLVMENPEFAVQVLNRVRELGAGLSLDDFGTGYSALSYLQKFPFDTLKVDKSFLAEMTNSGAAPVILKAIVSLAHELGLDVVAEGAETEEDVIALRNLGCEYAQGYYYGTPMTAGDALNYLAQTPSA